ncbi:YwdI family protein [Bacillus niameyensis]|uniref:YwdI family protein n=1 Tax=Bacillus niameyensis TaxID=1522308 RepID=UPI0007849B75|nr:YwdI family protein [Bacillus niameyensis]
MTISYDVIFEKMEHELKQAKVASNDTELQAHIYALKTLTEIILSGKSAINSINQQKVSKVNLTPQKEVHNLAILNSETPKSEDGANGDSIFDF